MPLPIAPITAFALRYGTVALATYAVARSVERGRRCQHAEDAHDKIPEGLTARRETDQLNATGRMRRVIRLGANGPGIEFDATAHGRVKFRKI